MSVPPGAGTMLDAVDAASPVTGSTSSAMKVLAELGVLTDTLSSGSPAGTLTS